GIYSWGRRVRQEKLKRGERPKLGPRLRGDSCIVTCALRALRCGWLGREGSNLRMPESKSGALPLGDAPIWGGHTGIGRGIQRGRSPLPMVKQAEIRENRPVAARGAHRYK